MTDAGLVREQVNSGAGAHRLAPALRTVMRGLLVCVAYLVAAEIGIALTLRPSPVSTLWPPNAVLLALLLLTPTRSWWTVILAALPAHLWVELRAGIPLPMVLSWFLSNSSEALIGAGLVRWLAPGPVRFDSFRRVSIFVLAAMLSVFLSSFLDAAFVQLNAWGVNSYWYVWRTRFFSNVLATLTVVPVIVTVGSADINALRRLSARRVFEAGLLAATLIAVCIFVFTWEPVGPNTSPALLYMPLPLLLWAAVRFGSATTSACLLAVSLMAIWEAIGGNGPFVSSTPAENALALQLFLIVIAVPLMTLAAVSQERLLAQDEARQSEERLKLALGAAQMGTWEWQLAGDQGSWSEKSREIFGLGARHQEFSLARFLELVSPEDRALVAKAIQRTVQLGAPYETEFRVIRPDGEARWVLAKGKPLFDPAGRPVRLLGVNTDITERKRADDVIREWKNRYEAAIESSNQLLYDWDPRTNDVTYGGDLARILGYPPEEMAGGLSRWMEKIHPEDRAAFEQETQRVLATGGSFQLTYRLYRKDGNAIWLEDRGHFFRDAEGRISRMVGFVEDVTERIRAEQALRSSEERFAIAFRSSPDAIMICRQSDGRILEVNDTWHTMFGHTREEVVGRTTLELGMHDDPRDRDRVRQLLADGRPVREYELDARTKSGELRQTVLSADTVEMGGEPCFITFVRDVTERKRVEAEAQEQRREVAHLSRVVLLGELSGALAHELNQPLTAILANARAAQRLLGSAPLNLSELGEILEDIAHDDRRAGDVISRLGAFLRKGDIQLRPLNLNEVVREALELVHSDLVQRMVTVDLRLEPSLPPVLADRVQLQQVMLNLILNACDAMSSNHRDQRRVTILTSADDGAVELSLADRGMGIPREKLDRIFEPFVTTKEKGLGLGLTICRSIVNAHGGRLWADNNADGGATFHLVLHHEVAVPV